MSVHGKHEQYMSYFQEEENALPLLRRALASIRGALADYDDGGYRGWIRREMAEAERRGFPRDHRSALEERRALAEDTPGHVAMSALADELGRKIRSVEDREEETTYMKGMVTLMQKYDGGGDDDDVDEPAPAPGGLGNFGFKRSIVSRKGGFFEDYVVMTTGGRPQTNNNEPGGDCNECGAPTVYLKGEALVVCTECGLTRGSCDVSLDAVPFVDRPAKISETGYKRINHFNEWLAQFQAKGSTEIHPDVINEVVEEFTKRRQKSSDVTPERVRKYLKLLGYTGFYEHIVQIASIISRKPPPYLTPQQEERLRIMFRLCQVPFDECPNKLKKDPATGKIRKNFPSYSYTLYKFCELMGYDDFLHYFKLLKSPKNLEQHDRMWEHFCSKLGWQFIPSSCMVGPSSVAARQ